MTFTIPDNILQAAKLNEREMLVELACHLFDIERLSLFEAATLAGMTRGDFEDALHDRHIPIYRYDLEDLEQDVRSIAHFKKMEK